ncbi:MAG: hypothetical protein FD176_2957, partial [Rhodospirillaceae bacterium]
MSRLATLTALLLLMAAPGAHALEKPR